MKRIFKRLSFMLLILGVFLISQTVLAEEKTEQNNPQKIEQKTEGRTEQKDQKKTEQKKEQKGSHKLEEITVTDKKPREPVTSPYAVTESSAPQTYTITAEEIEGLHPQTLWDVVEQLPGMEVTFQGRQHMDFSNMRGNGSYGIIIDGVYVSQLDRIFATLPVDAIESMTIVRDSTAITMGPLTNFGSSTGSSNQGFIVIKTKRAAKLEGGLVTSYGSFHTEKEHLYQGAKIPTKIGDFDYRIAGTYNNTLGKSNWYNASRNESLLFRGGYTGASFNADMLYYTSRGMREFQRSENVAPTTVTVGTGKNRRTYLDYSQMGQLSQMKWKVDPLISKRWSDTQTTTFQYAYNNIDVTSMTTNFPDGSTATSNQDQNSRGQSTSLRHVMTFRNNILKFGGQWNDYVVPTAMAPNTNIRTDEDMFGLYIQDEYHLFNDKLTLDAGIRADKKHYSNSPVTYRRTDEWGKETYAYTLGAAYKPHRMITLTGRYAYEENGQSSYQVSGTDRTILPAERRNRFEGGILANIHPFFQPFLTLFYYDTKDQKVSSTGTDPITGQTNVSYYIDPATGEEVNFVTTSDVRTKGGEFGISGQIFKPFTYRLQYTHVETDNTDTNRGKPHHLASGHFTYRLNEHLTANLSLRYVSSYSLTAYDERGDYIRTDANIAYNTKIFDRDAKITLYGRNLGNKAYYTSGNGQYYDPGISYGIQLAYSFF
jgi:hypothetical protein